MDDDKGLDIGTCSWKYGSRKGLVYPQSREFNHLLEYSKQFSTVEVDQWFWFHVQRNCGSPRRTTLLDCDGSYHRLKPIRMDGIKVYYGEVLSEHADNELDDEHFLYAARLHCRVLG